MCGGGGRKVMARPCAQVIGGWGGGLVANKIKGSSRPMSKLTGKNTLLRGGGQLWGKPSGLGAATPGDTAIVY